MNNDNLKQIFQGIKENRKEVFQNLYDEYFRTIYGIAFSVCKNEETSRDAVQNVILKLFTLPVEKFPTQNELTWLYTVTKNETLGLLRREKFTENIDELELPAVKTNIDDFVDMQNYYSIISDLNDKQREIVTLKVLGNMTHKQISELLKMKIGTVQWIYNTSIVKLRTKLLASGAFSIIFGTVFGTRMYKLLSTMTGGNDIGIESVPTTIEITPIIIISGLLFSISIIAFSYFFSKKIKKAK